MAPATSNVTQIDGLDQPSYFNQHWPVPDQAQSDYSSFWGLDDSFAGTMVSETPTVIPAPSSSKQLYTLNLLGNVLTNHEQSRSTTGG